MTKVTAIDKKGVEWDVVREGLKEVELQNGDTLKTIKNSTYNKSYERLEVVVSEEEVVEMETVLEECAVAAQEWTEMETNDVDTEVSESVVEEPVKEIDMERLQECIQAEKVEDVIKFIFPEDTEFEVGEELKEWLRHRDNARQCYKENETRFKRTLELYPEDHAVLDGYVEKMVFYHSKYRIASSKVMAHRKMEAERKKAEKEAQQLEEVEKAVKELPVV
jgi:hypothetical protein